MNPEQTVIIGAGPYGLSIAAHLQAAGVPVGVFGKTMELWRKMPPGLCLKSVWSASTLADPAAQWSLDRYANVAGLDRREPIALPDFLAYGRWFAARAVTPVDETYVRLLARDGARLRLELADGRSLTADRVVIAVGIEPFAVVPDFAATLPAALASHTQSHPDFAPFHGHAVAVLGRGQSALETAALLAEAGAAEVEVLSRGDPIWINRRLYRSTGPLKHVFYPPSDVGPPGLNWLVHFAGIYRHLPDETRARFAQRAVRPAGAPWLRARVEGQVRITGGVVVVRAAPAGDQLRLDLSDGTTRTVDHLFLGTGYRPHLDAVPFLDADLRRALAAADGFPVLDGSLGASVHGLHFAGALASGSYGPLCRFVAGAGMSARRITRAATRARARGRAPRAAESATPRVSSAVSSPPDPAPAR